jgi:hypothetical protein
MAMPKHLEGAATLIMQSLHSVAHDVRDAAGELDHAALMHVLASASAVADWRKDTTEASRRRAHGDASAALALCSAPVPGAGEQTRRVLGAYARALLTLTEGKTAQEAVATATAATRRFAHWLDAHS